MVEILLQQGADVGKATFSRHGEGVTALHVVVGLGSSRILRLLLDYGETADVFDIHGETPLHKASVIDHSLRAQATIQVLLDNGADVNLMSQLGRTPLHLLCSKKFVDHSAKVLGDSGVDTAKVLLDHGADLHAKDRDGKTPIDLSTEKQNVLLTLALLEAQSKQLLEKDNVHPCLWAHVFEKVNRQMVLLTSLKRRPLHTYSCATPSINLPGWMNNSILGEISKAESLGPSLIYALLREKPEICDSSN